MKSKYHRICEHCNHSFEAKSQLAKYCSNGCRVMAWKIKHGVPIPNWDPKEIYNRIPTKTETELTEQTRKLESVVASMARIKTRLNEDCLKENEKVQAKIQELEKRKNNRYMNPSYYRESDETIMKRYTPDSIEYQEHMVREELIKIGNINYNSMTTPEQTKFNINVKDIAYHRLMDIYNKQIQDKRREYDELYTEAIKELKEEADEINDIIVQLRKGYNIESLKEKGKVLSAEDILNKTFDTYKFDFGFERVFGTPDKSFIALLHGSAGSGKSSFAIQFASFFSSYGKVLYFALEEGISHSFKLKIQNNYGKFAGTFDTTDERRLKEVIKKIENYNLVIIDSVNYGLNNIEDIEAITRHRRATNTSFVLVFHETKAGDFKGDSYFGHLADIQLKAANGIITVEKNRFRLNNLRKEDENYSIFQQ